MQGTRRHSVDIGKPSEIPIEVVPDHAQQFPARSARSNPRPRMNYQKEDLAS